MARRPARSLRDWQVSGPPLSLGLLTVICSSPCSSVLLPRDHFLCQASASCSPVTCSEGMWGWRGASVGAQGRLSLCALLVGGWAEAAPLVHFTATMGEGHGVCRVSRLGCSSQKGRWAGQKCRPPLLEKGLSCVWGRPVSHLAACWIRASESAAPQRKLWCLLSVPALFRCL